MTRGLVGHVDQVNERSITGWLADLDRPGRLESVHCVDGEGRQVVFKTCHAREDVGRFFGVPFGRFGFVIPLAALGGLVGPVTVQDRFGAVLPGGGALAVADRAAGPAPNGPATMFLHIPKTAGTSVRHALLDGLMPYEWLLVYPPPFGLAASEMATLPMAQRRAARMVAGHMPFGIDRLLGCEARYVTFLREPMARLRSQAAHHHRAGTAFTAGGAAVTLTAAVNEGLGEEFDNLMVRVIAGVMNDLVPLGQLSEDEVELAMFNIERHFAFAGTVEALDRDMPALMALLGREARPMRRENANADADWASQAGRGFDWGRVEERNRFDRMLWERVQARGPQGAGG